MDASLIDYYALRGSKDKDWYLKCEALFVELFGRERLHLVTQIFAATSINSSLKSNVRLFRKALHEIETGRPFSVYLPVMLMQLRRIRMNEPISGRKINSFAKAMSGDPNAVVVDIWLLRAFKEDRKYVRDGVARSSGATDKQYNLIENFVRYKAYEMGIEPRQLSAMIWSGVRMATNNDRETHYENVLRQQLYNMYEAQSRI